MQATWLLLLGFAALVQKSSSAAPNTICTNNVAMNDRIRTRALDMHNYRRSQLALNKVIKNTGRLLPGARNMRKLVYDCNLEISARARAESCASTANPNPGTNIVENLTRFSKSTVTTRVAAMQRAVRRWWKQVRRVPGFGMNAIFRPKHQNGKIMSFIKMAWADTPSVGCAVSSRRFCGNFWTVVCQYSVNGFIPNSNVYLTGTACANCPTGTTCVQAEGLCA
ncbi:hypothetical protein Q1695_002113 [Nippostrongylus brasiliensis]|nr:hypothetical protein Q1695_002113 [Nippostrongylus brasiliensis]